MAFVVATRSGTFEIRESHNTPEGPRSRTLARFKELDDDVIAQAGERADKVLDSEQLRESAKRAGAPIAAPPVDRAARELLAQLAKGKEPEPKLRHLLFSALGDAWKGPATSPDSARSAAEWIAASPQERGKTLEDLLLLADALPSGGRKGKALRFPKLGPAQA
jgi:hypothetical protein